MEEALLLGREVLIVEDNSINQLLVKKLIEKLGAKVQFAVTGREAIEKFQLNNFDLVLLDIQLPELDGYEVATFLRNQLKTKVPIIAMTALALKGENEQCLKYGMNGYVAKPFSQHDLYEAIQKVLTSNEEITTNPYILTNKNVAVDISMLYEVAGDDAEYISAMVATFLETMATTLKKMAEQLEGQDYDALYKSAHFAKSSLSIIKVSNAYELTQKIEKNARTNSEIAEIPTLLKRLKEEILLADAALIERFGTAVKVA